MKNEDDKSFEIFIFGQKTDFSLKIEVFQSATILKTESFGIVLRIYFNWTPFNLKDS